MNYSDKEIPNLVYHYCAHVELLEVHAEVSMSTVISEKSEAEAVNQRYFSFFHFL